MSPALQNLMYALEHHLSRLVVPILRDFPDLGLDQIGTGTLLECRGLLYLLTAKHTFDRVPAEEIKIPDNPHGPGLIQLWPFQIIESDDGHDDVIVFKLQDHCFERVCKGWKRIPTSRCGKIDPSDDYALAVSGYPSNWGVQEGLRIGGRLVTSYTDQMEVPPEEAEQPVRAEFDLFLRYDAEGTMSDGRPLNSPRMGGVSGAAIWDIALPDNSAVWDPSAALRLVGVQTHTRHFKYIRGVNWRLIEERLVPKF